MIAFVTALLEALERIDTPLCAALTEEELTALAKELDVAALFVRHEQQRRAAAEGRDA